MEDFDKVSIEDDEFRFALQQLMRGNGNYFSLVFQKTRQSLYIFALLLVKEEEAAADLLKETYLRIVESAGSLRRTERFPLWARRIMHNLVLFKYGIERANGTEGADYDALMKKLVAERNDRTPSGEADEEELSRLLIETIFQLSTEERIALICFWICETSEPICESSLRGRSSDNRPDAVFAASIFCIHSSRKH